MAALDKSEVCVRLVMQRRLLQRRVIC